MLTCLDYQAIRRKATQEVQDIKEDLRKKEQIKEAAAKRREKQEELAAKERVRAQIKATQEERRLKAAREKAEREGQPLPQEPALQKQSSSAGSVGSTKPASAYSESRLRLQLPSGNVQKTFSADTTLFEVAAALEQENGAPVESFTQTFPRKKFSQGVDFGLTLKEAGLVPSAVLIVR
jgi:UBX domain-containing protein 1/4